LPEIDATVLNARAFAGGALSKDLPGHTRRVPSPWRHGFASLVFTVLELLFTETFTMELSRSVSWKVEHRSLRTGHAPGISAF